MFIFITLRRQSAVSVVTFHNGARLTIQRLLAFVAFASASTNPLNGPGHVYTVFIYCTYSQYQYLLNIYIYIYSIYVYTNIYIY